MSRITVQPNVPQIFILSSGGTLRTFAINADGTTVAPNSIAIQYVGQSFKGIIATTTITGADKTYTFPNRTGNIALEDGTSLNAMFPSQTGNAGKVWMTDGTVGSWQSVASGNNSLITLNGINCNTYNAQTFVIGTSGTAPAFVSVNNNTGTHTLNIPMASAAGVTAGLLSKPDYDNIPFKNAASNAFTNAPTITNPATTNNSVATYGQLLAMKGSLAARLPVDLIDTVTTATSLNGIATIDGISNTVGMRVLATVLTGGNAGKVYKCLTVGPTTWSLETDGQNGDGTPGDGDILFVRQGSLWHDQQWAYNGTAWVLYNVAQAWTFGTGLTVTGTTVTVSYGTTAGTSCQGNDTRLSDARTPTAHVLDSASHTISGKVIGQVAIATSPTTFGFVAFSGDIASISATGVVVINKISNIGINDLGLQQNSATLADNTATATLVTGCSFAIVTYRSAIIQFSISRGAGNFSFGEISIMHDGTNAYITVCENIYIGTHGITFTADINGGNLRLLYATTSTGTAATMKFVNQLFPV